LMMASIFFTERLPGNSNCRWFRCRARRLSGLILASGKAGLLIIAANCDDHELGFPNRLPQKQGLCQVVNAADFGTLSDF
jgi:hypothetical protein